MNFNLATIRIKNLRLRTYIGINEDEIKNKQDVVVNVKIDYDASTASNTDNMDDALNYKIITKAIIKLVEDNRFSLLEKLMAGESQSCRSLMPAMQPLSEMFIHTARGLDQSHKPQYLQQ